LVCDAHSGTRLVALGGFHFQESSLAASHGSTSICIENCKSAEK
jgi:hypothetical protein